MSDWIHANWPAPPSVHAGASRRRGGVSEGVYESLNVGDHVGDDPAAVVENRRRVQEMARMPAEPQWLQQVHGLKVVTLPHADQRPEADAAITTEKGVVCAVMTADCLPVVFARANGTAVGVAHAGWRGLCNGILEATVEALGAPDDLVVWYGPAISQSSFEVGREVREAFLQRDAAAAQHFYKNSDGRWQADLYGLASQRLSALGITDVSGGGRCTFDEAEQFFSYRRDGQTGRMATCVWID